MAAEIHLYDVGTAFRVTVKDEDEAVVDISTATVKTITFCKPDGTSTEKTASFYTDGTDGIMQYVAVSGDIASAGLWRLQGKVAVGGGTWNTEIHNFKVYDNIV